MCTTSTHECVSTLLLMLKQRIMSQHFHSVTYYNEDTESSPMNEKDGDTSVSTHPSYRSLPSPCGLQRNEEVDHNYSIHLERVPSFSAQDEML
jgi:hypothetical protein